MLDFNDVLMANKRIKPYLKEMPMVMSSTWGTEGEFVYFKLECNQPHAKSYKIRGALNKILSLTPQELNIGVCAISSGNHGAALAYAAYILKVSPCVIFAPTTTPQPKIDKMERYGAEVHLIGNDFDETHLIAEKQIETLGLIEVNPCEDPVAIAGHGTVALEMLLEEPDLEVIFVPIGGGGLITGVAVAAKAMNPAIQIIGVQTESSPAMVKSLADHVCYEYFKTDVSVCDALVGGISKLPYAMAKETIDEIIVVSEKSIVEATKHMLIHEKIVAEPSSAICYAAYSLNKERWKGKKVGMVITGGNINGSLIEKIIGGDYV